MRNSPDVVDGFRMRGREVTRLESFADAIFAFALTLLIVSLTTRFLTCVLLFIVLFYVYPLKFFFTLAINDMIFGPSFTGLVIRQGEFSTLFSIYSFGFAGVYLAFTLLYLHAWRLRDALDLSEIEKFETRYIICRVLAVAIVGLIAAGLGRMSWFP